MNTNNEAWKTFRWKKQPLPSSSPQVKWSGSVMSDSLDPMDCSLPGSSVHGVFQARVLEWVAISFSRGSSLPRYWTRVSCIVGRRFTLWATREITLFPKYSPKYRSGAESTDGLLTVCHCNTVLWSEKPLEWGQRRFVEVRKSVQERHWAWPTLPIRHQRYENQTALSHTRPSGQ